MHVWIAAPHAPEEFPLSITHLTVGFQGLHLCYSIWIYMGPGELSQATMLVGQGLLPTKLSLWPLERDFWFFRSKKNGGEESFPLSLCQAGKRDLLQWSGPATKMQLVLVQDMVLADASSPQHIHPRQIGRAHV